MISLILMHSGRDTGMGGMGFTPASQGGTHIVERNLTRFTIVIGILFFFIVPFVGIAAGIVGLILFVLFLAGVGRKVAEDSP
jgi:protein translocase SecG subunit